MCFCKVMTHDVLLRDLYFGAPSSNRTALLRSVHNFAFNYWHNTSIKNVILTDTYCVCVYVLVSSVNNVIQVRVVVINRVTFVV